VAILVMFVRLGLEFGKIVPEFGHSLAGGQKINGKNLGLIIGRFANP
jgi:hypothetical protein